MAILGDIGARDFAFPVNLDFIDFNCNIEHYGAST